METERLVKLANDISRFFEAEPDRAEAVKGVAGHMRRFWDPRMRREILAHARTGGAGLSEVALAAVNALEPPATA
jgi:formate dehydrogenase subunit delta